MDDGINGDDVPSKNGRSGMGATLLSPINGLESGARDAEASEGELDDTRGVTVEASIIGRRPREGTENNVVIVGVVSSSESNSSRNEGSLKLLSGRTPLVGPASPKITIQQS